MRYQTESLKDSVRLSKQPKYYILGKNNVHQRILKIEKTNQEKIPSADLIFSSTFVFAYDIS